jgi:hypothetical protein
VGAFLAAIYGLPMTEAQLTTFRARTARRNAKAG